MKKKVLVSSMIVLVVLFAISTRTYAQKNLSFGVKSNAEMTNFHLDNDAAYSNSKLGIGGSAGGFLKYDFSELFAVQADLMFRYRTSDLKNKTTGTTSQFKSYGLELPLYAVFQFSLGSGKLFTGLGPYIGYGISAKTGSVNMYKKDVNGKTPMERLNYGAAAMLGYEFGNFQVSASYISQYCMGLMGDVSSLQSQTFGLGVGYKF